MDTIHVLSIGNTINQITFQDFKEPADEKEYALAIETVNQIYANDL